MRGLVHDHHVEWGGALSQLVEQSLASGEVHRHDELALPGKYVDGRSLAAALVEVGAVLKDVEPKPELRPHLVLPPLRLGRGPRDDEDPPGLMPLRQPTQDDSGLRRLAQAGVVSDQETWAHRLGDAEEGDKLVGLDCHGSPIKTDELLATSGHRGQVCAVERPPSAPVTALDVEFRKGQLVWDDGPGLERKEGGELEVLLGWVKTDQADEAALFLAENPPAGAPPAHGLSGLQKRGAHSPPTGVVSQAWSKAQGCQIGPGPSRPGILRGGGRTRSSSWR